MRSVVVAGVGMTRFAKHPDRGMRSLAEEAVEKALADSGIAPEKVQAAYFGNAAAGLITGQETIRGQVALQNTGLLGIPIFNIDNACASASSAFNLAWSAVAYGQYECVIAVGAEKLTHPDKQRTFQAFNGAVDVERIEQLMALAAQQQKAKAAAAPAAEKKQAEGGPDHSPFMDIYASGARRYMEVTGATTEDLADVAVKNRYHASLNPHAQYRDVVSREEVLSSRVISPPLTLYMCSPIGDGGAAAVICSQQAARKLGVRPTVKVRASVVVSGSRGGPSGVDRAVKQAYETAGVGPQDLNVAEVHDAAANAELGLYETLGLCGPADGKSLIRDGATRLGGRIPVNTSGGLLSKGHPVGATGLAQIAEVTWQLRGTAGDRQVEGATVGLTQNAGGSIGTDSAAASVHVLSR